VGIGSENKILSDIFNVLSKIKVHIEAVTTSELSINIFLRKKYLDQAITALLDKLNLKNSSKNARKIREERK